MINLEFEIGRFGLSVRVGGKILVSNLNPQTYARGKTPTDSGERQYEPRT